MNEIYIIIMKIKSKIFLWTLKLFWMYYLFHSINIACKIPILWKYIKDIINMRHKFIKFMFKL